MQQHDEVAQPFSGQSNKQKPKKKYQQKRWWFAISSIVIVIVILTAWTTRNRQAIAIATPYLAPYDMQITCLDWSLSWENSWRDSWKNSWEDALTITSQGSSSQNKHEREQTGLNQPNIEIKQLCLSHPLGEVAISNLIIDNIKAPKVIFIGQINISANKTLGQLLAQLQSSTTGSKPSLEKQLDDIQQQLSKTLIPFDFALGKLTLNAPNLTTPFEITGSQGAQNLVLQINNQQQTLTLAIDYQKQSANINANIDLAPLFTMLTQQQVKLPPPLTPASIQTKIAGTIQTDITYQNNQITADYRATSLQATLNQLKVNLPKTTQGQLTVNSDTIKWQNTATPINISLNAHNTSKQTINKQIINALNPLSDKLKHQVKQLLAANPINTIDLNLPANSIARFEQDNIQLSNLTVQTNNQRLNTEISDIKYTINTRNFAFNLTTNSTLNLPQLNQITEHPVKASLRTTMTGQLKPQSTNMRLSDDSQITLSLNQLKHQQITAETLDIEITGPINWQNNQLSANTASNILFSNVKHPKLTNIDSFALNSTHKLTGKPATLLNQSTTQLLLNSQTMATVIASGQLTKPHLSIKSTDISLYDLAALNRSKVTLPELVSGKLDIVLETQLNNLSQPLTNNITGQFTLKDVSGEHKNTWFESLNYTQNFTINNGLLSTQNTNNLTISKIETGAILTDTKAQLNYQANLNAQDIQPTFSLNVENVSTQAFGGLFSFAGFSWPKAQTLNLILDAIDLEKVVALEKQQGIKVTGLISGELPTTITKPEGKWAVTIDNGEIHNITDGVIQIKNNPAVKRLKNSRDDLRLAFDALQNLHYHQLSSAVTMSNDGQMYLETVIKGINPDLDNEVNFNLNLDYDLLGLLQSALISKNVEQQVNDKVNN